ncbi:FAD-binding, type 2 [Penicillium occitanis (nom. inval.)]|nr:FAD-binding, type 2 [Penicillium occitanis (nom. inval.)]PCH00631.1 hypothetical protein PENOC_052180 [Penicillium occitanis (nom. inval.)]
MGSYFAVRLSIFLHWLYVFASSAAATGADLAILRSQLSPDASVSWTTSIAPRWSDYDAPKPTAIINVAVEKDVQTTIQFCNSRSIPYLVQNGAHGSSTTLGQLAHNGVIINLAALNRVTFNADKTLVSLEGGTLMSEMIQSAYSNSALVLSGTCNCIGYLGALLGGGFGYLIGQYGLMLDNVVSLNVVLASGQAISVTPSDDEDKYDESLWWAMRGAGPNFGAVTSAVVKSYPVDSNSLNAWLGPLLFEDTQLDTLIQTMNDITLEPEMAMSLTFASSGNASASPSIILTVFYHGTEAQGKAAFAPIYKIGPVADETTITAYPNWNAAQDISCVKGGNKPSFGAGLAELEAESWKAVYDAYKNFILHPEAQESVILLSAYPTAQIKSIPDASTAYPFRSTVRFNAQASLAWNDSSFDASALAFGTSTTLSETKV